MLEAVLKKLPNHLGPCRFSVLTTYPDADRRECGDSESPVRIVSARPLELLLTYPFALLAGLAGALGLPRSLCCITPAMRTLAAADVVVDLAGISFVDGRGLPLLGYNVLMTSTPLLLGRPVVKAGQALGPFQRPLNRWFARRVLPRLEAICARGPETERHVRGLGLENVHAVADLAFTLPHDPEAEERVRELAKRSRAWRVGVVPSAVVQAYCRSRGVDYASLLSELIDRIITEESVEVVVFPHAARRGKRKSRMNDLPLCRRIREGVESGTACQLVDRDLTPGELRALIAACDVVLTSRFHAMISALTVATPVLVTAWSHKYGEVLEEFGLEDFEVHFSDLDVVDLEEKLEDIRARHESIVARIRQALPAVIERSERNYRVIAAAVRSVSQKPSGGTISSG